MIENVVSKRYAKALSSSISEEGILKRALESLKAFADAIESDKQLERFFSHPGIPETKKTALVDELCKRLQAENAVRSLLTLLTQRRKILLLKYIAGYFETVVNERLNQVRVHVTSAQGASYGLGC